ncbi:MAG: hypothetical protein AAGG46_02995, partial [Planctomycetota bacterium]
MLFALVPAAVGGVAQAQDQAQDQARADLEAALEDKVLPLVAGLVADTRAERDAAAAKLVELAGSTPAQADRVLEALPEPNEQMLPVFRERLAAVRQAIEQLAARA